MGTDCKIVVLGGAEDLTFLAQTRVQELATLWTRFDASSELSRFNRNAGRVTRVSGDLMDLLRRGLAGYRLSAGVFDPFVESQMLLAGYDRDFDQLPAAPLVVREQPVGQSSRAPRAVGAITSSAARSGIGNATVGPRTVAVRPPLNLDIRQRLAYLEPGAGFDSGGIGKGLGAQIVASELIGRGALGAMVSLGGDVAVAGSYPDQGWRIGVKDPFDEAQQAFHVTIRSGGLSTSSILKRRWAISPGPGTTEPTVAHHLIDPATGAPAEAAEFVAATAISPVAWRAEVFTKMVILGGGALADSITQRFGQVALFAWDRRGSLESFQRTS